MSAKISTHSASLRVLKSYSSVTRKYSSTHTYSQPKKPVQVGACATIADETKPTAINSHRKKLGCAE